MQCEPTNSTDFTNTTVLGHTIANVTDRPTINDTIDIVRLIRNLRGKCGFEYEIIDVLAERSEEQRQELINFCTLRYKKVNINIMLDQNIKRPRVKVISRISINKIIKKS